MRAKRRVRLFWLLGLSLLVASALAMILYAMRQNINLYYTPEQVTQGQVPHQRLFRLGGMVELHSLQTQGVKLHFVVVDGTAKVPVVYQGILPDLFKEGAGVVAEGRLNAQGTFVATEILAKHDENYMPPVFTKPS